MQRSNSNINTDMLILDGTKYTEDELMDGWKIHFEKLALFMLSGMSKS
jgi:hypothetical protein